MHRLHLVAADGDFLTVLVPLTDEGVVDLDAPGPWLFKGTWDGTPLVGELRIEESGAVLCWSDSDYMPIDLLGHSLREGRVVTARSSSEGRIEYMLSNVLRV